MNGDPYDEPPFPVLQEDKSNKTIGIAPKYVKVKNPPSLSGKSET